MPRAVATPRPARARAAGRELPANRALRPERPRRATPRNPLGPASGPADFVHLAPGPRDGGPGPPRARGPKPRLQRCHAVSAGDRGVSLLHLLREVILVADLADQLQLGLEPVGVLLLADEDLGEQVLGRVVGRLARSIDALVQERDRRVLE